MTKKEFTEYFDMCNHRFGSTLETGDVTFNEGVIYNPRINNGYGYQAVGENAHERNLNAVWRQVKKNGGFTIGNKEYKI